VVDWAGDNFFVMDGQKRDYLSRASQAFQRDGKYSRGENVAAMNIFHHVGKPAIIAQKLQRVACNKLHMKPRH